MTSKDQPLSPKINVGLDDFSAQMAAPFYALSNFFLNAVNLQTDVVRLVNKESGSNNESGVLALDASKLSPRVYSILQQKVQASQIEDYITKLVEEDLDRKEEAAVDTLREEIFNEISKLKQNLASQPDVTGEEADQANDLRESVAILDEQKLDKEEFQTFGSKLRSELLDQINLLRKELALGQFVSAEPIKSNPDTAHIEKGNDLKEGQLLENSQVIGTIKEVIDVDF